MRSYLKLCIAFYNLIRIKLKIAYMAAKKQVSILELFVEAILKSYGQLKMNDASYAHMISRKDNLYGLGSDEIKVNALFVIDQLYSH